uniref:Uncharacterized protein n=1 Tax=Arundo donax TaxID=35708 RepID=A0A0A9AQJ1_ARUDO
MDRNDVIKCGGIATGQFSDIGLSRLLKRINFVFLDNKGKHPIARHYKYKSKIEK